MTNEKEKQIEQKVMDLPESVSAIGQIIDEKTLQRYNKAKVYIKSMIKEVNAFWEPLRKKAYDSYKEINDKKKAHLEPLEKANKIADRELTRYFTEQRRIREEEERKRREEEERKRREHEEKMKAAEEADKSGDRDTADNLITELAEEENQPEDTPEPIPEKPKADNIHTRTEWDIEIIDPNIIPRKFMVVDEKKIKKIVKASGGEIEIPGVKNISKEIPVTRV